MCVCVLGGGGGGGGIFNVKVTVKTPVSKYDCFYYIFWTHDCFTT